MRYALIDPTGRVVNVIEVEPGAISTEWKAPAGHTAVPGPVADVGDVWQNRTFYVERGGRRDAVSDVGGGRGVETPPEEKLVPVETTIAV